MTTSPVNSPTATRRERRGGLVNAGPKWACFAIAAALLAGSTPIAASDDGFPLNGTVIQDPGGQSKPGTDSLPGCNPYININPPEVPPDAQNINGFTYTIQMDGICGNWKPSPDVIVGSPLRRV